MTNNDYDTSGPGRPIEIPTKYDGEFSNDAIGALYTLLSQVDIDTVDRADLGKFIEWLSDETFERNLFSEWTDPQVDEDGVIFMRQWELPF